MFAVGGFALTLLAAHPACRRRSTASVEDEGQ